MDDNTLSKIDILLNALLFQFTWFSLVLNWFDGYLGLLGILLMVMHLLLVAKITWQHVSFIISIIVVGFVTDSILSKVDIYSFGSESLYPYLPIWLLGLWVAFSLTLNYSLYWLINKPLLFIVFMSIVGPFSYFVGEAFTVIYISQNKIYIFLQWFLLSVIFLSIRFLLNKSRV